MSALTTHLREKTRLPDANALTVRITKSQGVKRSLEGHCQVSYGSSRQLLYSSTVIHSKLAFRKKPTKEMHGQEISWHQIKALMGCQNMHNLNQRMALQGVWLKVLSFFHSFQMALAQDETSGWQDQRCSLKIQNT